MNMTIIGPTVVKGFAHMCRKALGKTITSDPESFVREEKQQNSTHFSTQLS